MTHDVLTRSTTSRVPPDAPGTRLMGSASDLRHRVLDAQVNAMTNCGDVVRFVAGPPGARLRLYSVYAPEGVQQILATNSRGYRKDNRFYREIRAQIGDGLLTSQDDEWLRQKRFVQPSFTRERVTAYAPVMAAQARELVERWHGAANSGEPVELHAAMTELAMRIVGRLLFGADLERAAGVLHRDFPVLSGDVRRRGFNALCAPRSWPTPANRRAARARRSLYGVVDELIAERRASGMGGDDLLGRLLAARDADTQLDNQEIRDQLLVFMFAGHDTTATALSFALHLLGTHDHVQRRAIAEVDDVLAGAVPEAQDVPELAHLGRVVRETLRLYPPAYGTSRRVVIDEPVCGYRIPPGSDVAVYTYATHRHPRHWDDPERFDPDRFLPEPSAGRHRYAWFPFGGGPRGCIGTQFALLESTIVLATILQRYRVSTPPGPVPLATRITLHPAVPMPCRLTLRR
ncbi:MAG TPA: cytochrome P450 [Jatrophihabitantaceae bacterium]|jgi:cytochrome P450